MNKFTTLLLLLSVTPLTGCFLDDLSHVEPITASGSVSLDNNTGLVGNQIIERRDNYWVKGQLLPAKNASQSGESVCIKYSQAIIADAFQQEANIFEYQRESQSWELNTHISAPDLGGFGESVYIDKEMAIVGAPYSETVVVYTIVDGQWEETARLLSPLNEYGYFGGSVDRERDYVFVGAKAIDKVFIYRVSGNELELSQVIDSFDTGVPGGKQFGWSIDAEQDQLFVAAYRDWSDAEHTRQGGKVHVYQLENQQWVWRQTISPFDDSSNNENIDGDSFGHNLHAKNDNLVVGDDGLGRIFHYVQDEQGVWNANNVIYPPENMAHSFFGYDVAINNHYLLTGGRYPVLFGPQIEKVSLSGRVVDANGFPIFRANVNGFLADISTNEAGLFTYDVAFDWRGVVSVNYFGEKSDDVKIRRLKNDQTLNDIQLNVVPEYDVMGYTGTRENVSVNVSGIDEPIQAVRGRFSVSLPNGWSGEIRPTSDHLIFTPEAVLIEGLNTFEVVSFQATEK